MHKWILSSIVLVACALGVYLLAAGLPDRPHEEVLPEGQERLTITGSNFEFNQQEYRVKAGTTYQIKYSDKLGKHGVEIKGLDINLSAANPTVEYTFDTPGEYEIVCSIMCGTGHADMKSILIVE
jgi:cytochrome c oxidase subunit 2